MKLEPSQEQAAEFYKHLQSDLEKQMEAEKYFMESMTDLCGIPHDLFADDEVPITEEELFHIIKEQEISEQDKIQY